MQHLETTSDLAIPGECPDIERLRIDRQQFTENVGHSGTSDKESIASDESAMPPFEDYKPKIQQLLESIGFHRFSVEVIQHGYGFMNCVYALTSPNDTTEQYILRVAIDGAIRESDGRHETMENDIALLGHLKDRLLVPRIKAYSVTTDNVLEAAYTIQTRIPGQSLDKLWAGLDYADKYAIVDEFLVLLVKIEAVTFSTAGNIGITAALPVKMNDFSDAETLQVNLFDIYCKGPLTDTMMKARAGPNVKSLLISHVNQWIQEEIDRGEHQKPYAITPKFQKLLSMVEEMESEGYFNDQPFPIVLHHWDLEPRNLMVSKSSGAWKICGIIDWDDTLALPTPLARVPPRWIWHFPDEEPGLEDGYMNDDQYRDPELSEQDGALKKYFDEEVDKVLPGYANDAYGRGRWLRRIWYFAKEGAFRTWEWEFLEKLPEEWAARSKGIVAEA